MLHADHAPIHELIAAYESSLKAGNAEAVAALFGPDGEACMHALPSVIGQDAVRAAYELIFSSAKVASTFRVHDLVVSGDVAWATTSSTGWITFIEQGVTSPRSNRAIFTFAKVDGEWRISRYIYNKAVDSSMA